VTLHQNKILDLLEQEESEDDLSRAGSTGDLLEQARMELTGTGFGLQLNFGKHN